MSYSETKFIDAEGNVASGNTYHNGWGSGPFIWTSLCKRYRPGFDSCMFPEFYPTPENWRDLWKAHAAGDLPLEPWEHNALVMTYDLALIKLEDMRTLAESLRKFSDRYSVELDGGGRHVNHLPAFAAEIEARLAVGDVFGFGVYLTSVSDDQWTVIDERIGEDFVREYNINTDEGHWFAEIKPTGSTR